MKKKEKRIKGFFWHRLIYTVCRPFVRLMMRFRFGQRYQKMPSIKGPYFVMCNHTTESDMLMLVGAFRKHMYFVCSEHLLRNGRKSTLLKTFVNPIPMFKGSVGTRTVREILFRLKRGANIAIFPEGSRSFDGITGDIVPSTGQMVKLAKVGLVTYRLTGGYFIAPRWTRVFRRGPMRGEVVHAYSAEELAGMTAEEITAHIREDLYENAYETQRKDLQKYTCEALAEGLENFLYLCPRCGAYLSLHSKGDTFGCACGLDGRYDEYGFLRGEGVRFDSVADWGHWQAAELTARVAAASDDEVLFRFPRVTFSHLEENHVKRELAVGELTVTREGFSLGEYTYSFLSLEATEMLNLGNTFLFSKEGAHFDLTDPGLCAILLRTLYFLAKERHGKKTDK